MRAAGPMLLTSVRSFFGSRPFLRKAASKKMSGLEPGRKDMILLPLSLLQSKFGSGLRPISKKPSVAVSPANTTGYLSFNYNVKEFQNVKVRQAVAQAINKKAIVDALYGGTGLVASQFQPPALWGYNKTLKDWNYDTAAAKKLLADAGYPNGLSEITWADGKKEPLTFWYMPVSRPYFPKNDRR